MSLGYKQIEATRLDYKLSLEEGKPKSWLKSVSAFANSQGGHILFGVTNDTHFAIGLDDPQLTTTENCGIHCSKNLPDTKI